MTIALAPAARARSSRLNRVVEDLAGGAPYTETIEKVKTADISISRGKAEALAALVHYRFNMPQCRSSGDRIST
jgi:hypothetical protein